MDCAPRGSRPEPQRDRPGSPMNAVKSTALLLQPTTSSTAPAEQARRSIDRTETRCGAPSSRAAVRRARSRSSSCVDDGYNASIASGSHPHREHVRGRWMRQDAVRTPKSGAEDHVDQFPNSSVGVGTHGLDPSAGRPLASRPRPAANGGLLTRCAPVIGISPDPGSDYSSVRLLLEPRDDVVVVVDLLGGDLTASDGRGGGRS